MNYDWLEKSNGNWVWLDCDNLEATVTGGH